MDTKKRTLLLIGVCFGMSVGVVILLFAVSRDLKRKPGSFLREFPPHPALEGDSLNIQYNSYYIAGGTDHTAYLGNYVTPLRALAVNLARLDTQHVVLDVKGIMDQKFWSARLQVDSPDFYVTDGAVPRIYRGKVTTWHAERFPFDSTHYRDIVPISRNTFAVKTVAGKDPQNAIGKISITQPHFTYNGNILRKQVDGLFCTDGMLHYDRKSGRIVYVYYYRNEYFVIDTVLKLVLGGHTLDTISKAQIKVATISSADQLTMASPPLFVNKKSCISGDRLFVNSNMQARNQTEKAFDQGDVIDVYDLREGKYQFSFYIYNFQGDKRMIEFAVFGSRILVLYDKLIRVYDLVPQYFPEKSSSKRELSTN